MLKEFYCFFCLEVEALPSSQNEVINNDDDDLYSDDFLTEDPHDATYSPDILESSQKSSETWSEDSSQQNYVRI